MRQKRIKFAHIHTQCVDDLLCLQILILAFGLAVSLALIARGINAVS